MRISVLSFGLLALLTPLTAAWSKEDREIFRVRDELISGEGKDVTFYDFMGVSPSASNDEISKAYRKKSRSLHPDKVKQQLAAERARQKKKAGNKKPGVHVSKPPSASEVKAAVKAASERQARLSIVANILRGESRERYDHFLSNGFPTWKGTNYYYNRYRPGLGTALLGVFIAGGGAAHYLALYMSWKRQREFVGRYISFARQTAWGDNLGIPGVDAAASRSRTPPPPPPPPAAGDADEPPMAMNRKQRRMQERESKREAAKPAGRSGRRRGGGGATAAAGSGTATPTPQPSGPTGAKKRVVAENGKVLVVDSLGDVYLEEEDEEGNVEEFLLDPNEIQKPTIKDTALWRLPIWAYHLTVGRVLRKKGTGSDDDEEEEEEERSPLNPSADDDDDDDSEPGKRTPSTDSVEDFELLEKSTDSLTGQAKSTGAQGRQGGGGGGGKAGKRKGRKK